MLKRSFDKNIRDALSHNGIEVKSTEYIIADNANKISKRPREVVSIEDIKLNTNSRRTVVSNRNIKNPASTGLVPEYTFE